MAAPAAAAASYTLRELLRDASFHALPVGPDSSESRVQEVLAGTATTPNANPAQLPNTLLRVETLAKVVEALGLVVASRVRRCGGCSSVCNGPSLQAHAITASCAAFRVAKTGACIAGASAERLWPSITLAFAPRAAC